MNATPIKIPMTFFTEIVKTILNHYEREKTRTDKTTLSKKKNIKDTIFINFMLFYRAKAAKSNMILAQNRHANEWSRIEDPKINP
jgi:hypothetical protein